MSMEQMNRLSLFLKNRVKSVVPRELPRGLIMVNRAIDKALEDFFADERLRAYEAVDVDDILEDLETYVKTLGEVAKRMDTIIVDSTKLVTANYLLKPVTVGTSGRVTLSEFDKGVVLSRRHLRKRDGTLGGVELLVMKR